jgi:hypothetical protein
MNPARHKSFADLPISSFVFAVLFGFNLGNEPLVSQSQGVRYLLRTVSLAISE